MLVPAPMTPLFFFLLFLMARIALTAIPDERRPATAKTTVWGASWEEGRRIAEATKSHSSCTKPAIMHRPPAASRPVMVQFSSNVRFQRGSPPIEKEAINTTVPSALMRVPARYTAWPSAATPPRHSKASGDPHVVFHSSPSRPRRARHTSPKLIQGSQPVQARYRRPPQTASASPSPTFKPAY